MEPDEEDDKSAFAPRKSLARTPPKGLKDEFGRVRSYSTGAEKRTLTSPEEVGSTPQRQHMGVGMCRPATPYKAATASAPPLAGILTMADPGPSRKGPKKEASLIKCSKLELLDKDKLSLNEIMTVVTGSTSRLNKQDTNTVKAHVNDILAVVAALNIKLSDAELNLAEARLKATVAENKVLREREALRVEVQQPVVSYATALKLDKGGAQTPMPTSGGPLLAFYPTAEQQNKLKTAEDTKAELKKAIKPMEMEVQVERVRKVGNAGVVVQTTTQEAAEKLKKAVPPTLRVEVPKRKMPQVSLSNLDGDPDSGEILVHFTTRTSRARSGH